MTCYLVLTAMNIYFYLFILFFSPEHFTFIETQGFIISAGFESIEAIALVPLQMALVP